MRSNQQSPQSATLLRGQLQQAVQRCMALEQEVAEARQLKEEEEELLGATVAAMERVWQQLVQVGCCRPSGGRGVPSAANA
jgi:hypothetical protein